MHKYPIINNVSLYPTREEWIMMKSTFEYAMSFGHEALDKGDLQEAQGRFAAAVAEADTSDEKAKSLQMLGVALRLHKDLRSAEVRLLAALENALDNNPTLRYKILRDLGMVYLDTKRVSESRYEFTASHQGLKRVLGDHDAETLASLGFLGRSYLHEDNKTAKKYLLEAADGLRGQHDVYELNNLIWLLRASVLSRLRRGPRAIQLALRLGNKQRLIEAVILIFTGEHVYHAVKHLKSRKRLSP